MTININDYYWMRNDYMSDIEYCGVNYPTLEHAYQAAKLSNKQDKEKVASIVDVKQMRKFVRGFSLPTDWEDKKIDIMRVLLRRKFDNEILKSRLAGTGTDPIELVGYDNFWGTGKDNMGENILGTLLNDIRSDIQLELNPEDDNDCFDDLYDDDEDDYLDEEEEDDEEECCCDCPCSKSSGNKKFNVSAINLITNEPSEDWFLDNLYESLSDIDECPELKDAIITLFQTSTRILKFVDPSDFDAAFISRRTGVSKAVASEMVKELQAFVSSINTIKDIVNDEA